MDTENTTPSDKKALDIGPAIELLKGVGLIVGSLGSLAVLFFWIGNAIIVARLRAYNLYGIVHYTDDYVKEAGYQFFQDIFTFFQQPELLLLFILATSLVVASIPVGPFSSNVQTDLLAQRWIFRLPMSIVLWIRGNGIHYFLFLGLALSAGISLTSNWAIKNLSSGIIAHERLLANIFDAAKDKLLVFVPKDEVKPNRLQQGFYDALISSEVPKLLWLSHALSELYPDALTGDSPLDLIERFQKDFAIKEGSDFKSEEEFKRSATFQTLRNIRITRALNRKLRESVESTLWVFRNYLSGHLTGEEDFSSLVVIPASYEIVNDSIRDTQMGLENILAFFKPVDKEFEKLMLKLLNIRPLRFGSTLLSFSFWVLVWILIYLLANIPRILTFKHWEKGYYFLILLLFLTIAVALPTAYGRYKFEFKVQKLNDIIFSGDDSSHPIKKRFKDLWDKRATLYVLGPTKGREVIVGAIKANPESPVTSSQILMLDRDSFKFVIVEPVQVQEIQQIIRILQEKGQS